MRPVADALGSLGGLLGSSTSTAPSAGGTLGSSGGAIWSGLTANPVVSVSATRPSFVMYSLGTLISIRRFTTALGTPWVLPLVATIASTMSSCTQSPSCAAQTSTM